MAHPSGISRMRGTFIRRAGPAGPAGRAGPARTGRSGGRLLAHLRAMDGHSEAVVDLGAIRSNVVAMAEHVGNAQVMAVVKSDGYGHGLLETATAALAGGAAWLGVGHVAEALALRAAGVTAPVLCLL